MRKFLFRGKRRSNGKWVNGYYLKHTTQGGKRESFIYYVDTEYNVIPETIEQYTGLTDKNGVKIFEGDIVSFADCRGTQHKGVVYWCLGSYDVDCSKSDNEEDKDSFRLFTAYVYGAEIIGNIHDNPKLLE